MENRNNKKKFGDGSRWLPASNGIHVAILVLIVVLVVFFVAKSRTDYNLPKGETVTLEEFDPVRDDGSEANPISNGMNDDNMEESETRMSDREIFVTDGTKHSIPLGGIRSGGPGKDGIPSIDNPQFVQTSEADFITNESIGLGLSINGESKFYPYSILVWHEIVNDFVGGESALVTYCPLCGTGVVFDPRVDNKAFDFGVSGMLWQSNLLMYNRTGNPDTESLWSQVLGEAVVGPETGTKLSIIPSDTVRFSDWKSAHPDTLVLSTDTGTRRDYSRDPYGSYYTDETLIFDVDNTDNRLHPKTLVAGVEVEGKFKAYEIEKISTGTTNDTLGGVELVITKDEDGIVRINRASGEEVEILRGFWFSWVSVHPETELF